VFVAIVFFEGCLGFGVVGFVYVIIFFFGFAF